MGETGLGIEPPFDCGDDLRRFQGRFYEGLKDYESDMMKR